MARLSEYNYEMCVEICSEVANGFNIKTVLKSKAEYPTFQTWCNWKREHKELFDLYVKTMQDKAESEMEEIDRVYDMLKNGEIEPSAANVLIQTNKWKAAKFYPKMFGDKIQQELSGEVTTNTTQIVVEITPPTDVDDD
jgi:hypothetical protein